MKDKVTAALVQFAPAWLEREKNAERMRVFAQEQIRSGAQLVVFPELANTGYITPAGPGEVAAFAPGVSATDFAVRYVQAAEAVPGPTTEVLGEVCRRHGAYIIVGLAQLHPHVPATLFNSSVLIGPRGVIGVHHKMHIPGNEKHYFYPGSTCEVFSTDLGMIGMTVCYDGRFPELNRMLALKGAEIISAIYAVPISTRVALGDPHLLKYRAAVRAQENSLYYLACSRTGSEGSKKFLGHSAVGGPDGNVIGYLDSDAEEVLRAELSNEELVRSRVRITHFRDRRPELYGLVTEPFATPYRPNDAAAAKAVGADGVAIDHLTSRPPLQGTAPG